MHTEVRTQQFKCIANKDGSLPGLHSKHLYVSMFSCSQTSCNNWKDISPNGLALLLFECHYMKSICPFTTSSVFFDALWVRLPYRFSSILCTVLSSFSTMMSLAGGIFFFLSCSHQFWKSKISVYRARWKMKSFLLPPPPPASKIRCILLQ